MSVLYLIKSDLKAIGAKTSLFYIIIYFLFSFNKRAVMLIRLANGYKFFQAIGDRWLKSWYLIELGCRNIGPYLRIPHPKGITLAATKIGSNCMIGQWVTLGGNNCEHKMFGEYIIKTPSIGDNVQIYSGSVVAGPIDIGNDVIIGANTTVTFDIDSNSMVYNRPQISRKKVKVFGYKGAFEKYE